jgi:hypothetical protein
MYCTVIKIEASRYFQVEANVNVAESGCDQVQLLGAGSCVEDGALLCLADPQEEQETIAGFQEFNETGSATTSELCRICACASQDLIPIFSIDGEHLQLAAKIIRHLPITVIIFVWYKID